MSNTLFDPRLLQVDAIAAEAAVPPENLSAAALRQRFSLPPQWCPEVFSETSFYAKNATFSPASVLMPIVVSNQKVTMLFTQRADELTDHAGQISFPGGRAEGVDASAIDTALRETEEEIGLHRRHIEVIGTLPPYITNTSYKITPVVALVHSPFTLSIDPREVKHVFEVPIEFLMNGAHHQRRSVALLNLEGRRHFYTMPYGEFFIWGATAGMLRNLFHFLRA